MRRLFIFALAMIIYSGHLAGADSKEFIYERDTVRSLMNRGKVKEAINRWELKREMYGETDGRYEHELGNLYFNVGRYTDAKTEFESGIRVNQEYGPLYMGLALVNAKLGRDQEAYPAASQAIEKFPNWFGGYFAMANLDWQKKKLLSAKEYAEASLKREETPEAYGVLAGISYELGYSEEVINSINGATKLDHNLLGNRDLMVMLSVSNAKLKRFDVALEALATLKKNGSNLNAQELDGLEMKIKNLKQQFDR